MVIKIKKYTHVERVVKDKLSKSLNSEFHQEINDVTELVESVLSKDIHSRNSDIWLLLMCWKNQSLAYPKKINGQMGFFIPVKNVNLLQSPSSIFRARRELNYNLNLYLTTDPKILTKRKIRNAEFKQEFSK